MALRLVDNTIYFPSTPLWFYAYRFSTRDNCHKWSRVLWYWWQHQLGLQSHWSTSTIVRSVNLHNLISFHWNTLRVSWLKDGQTLSSTPGNVHFIESNTSRLMLLIDPLTVLDGGSYKCQANNSFGLALSAPIELTQAVLVSYPPGKFISILYNASV